LIEKSHAATLDYMGLIPHYGHNVEVYLSLTNSKLCGTNLIGE